MARRLYITGALAAGCVGSGDLQARVSGRIVDETPEKIVIQPNPLLPDRVEVKMSEIAGRTPSKLSPMPEGLLNNFAKEDILDLLAYIESMGKARAANFKK